MSEDVELALPNDPTTAKRIVVVSGPPCSGKSELAMRFAYSLIKCVKSDRPKPPVHERMDRTSPGMTDFQVLASQIKNREVCPLISMDGIRLAVIPGLDHDKRNRNISYRAMHGAARSLLFAGVECVVLE